MQLPASVNLVPSRKLAQLLIVAHIAASLAVGVVAIPVWIKVSLLVIIGGSWWSQHRWMYGARRIVHLVLREKGRLAYTNMSDETSEAGVHLQSTVTPLLTVILLKGKKGLETLVLLPDSLNRDDFRRLRLWLRWQGADR